MRIQARNYFDMVVDNFKINRINGIYEQVFKVPGHIIVCLEDCLLIFKVVYQ